MFGVAPIHRLFDRRAQTVRERRIVYVQYREAADDGRCLVGADDRGGAIAAVFLPADAGVVVLVGRKQSCASYARDSGILGDEPVPFPVHLQTIVDRTNTYPPTVSDTAHKPICVCLMLSDFS